jgi:hypothetical protein
MVVEEGVRSNAAQRRLTLICTAVRNLDGFPTIDLHAVKSIPGTVRRLRPWRERTQVVVEVAHADVSELTANQRVMLRLSHPSDADDESLPPGLGKSQSKPARLQRLVSDVYCTCGMHDGCAGHGFTLGACNSSGSTPCGLAKRTREEIGELID